MSKQYECHECGAKGVKLWRPYNSFSVDLTCVGCSEEAQGKVWELRPEVTEYHRGRRNPSDQIGWLVPAVPDDDFLPGHRSREGWECSDAFWGYTSVPQHGCDWWRALPLEVAA